MNVKNNQNDEGGGHGSAGRDAWREYQEKLGPWPIMSSDHGADTVRVEDAFLSVGADPEHSAIIHAYHHDPLVHALADKLAECLERLRRSDGPESNPGCRQATEWDDAAAGRWLAGLIQEGGDDD